MADDTVKPYGPSNTHPLFGKDPNILNEYGHTKYPMWIDHPTEKVGKFPKRVLVENPMEEHQVKSGADKSDVREPAENKSWGK